MNSKVFPRHITSYDLLKTFAVITMVIDHIGVFLMPDEDWLRAVGRLSFPVWLFLIGYAQSRDIPKLLTVGAVLVAAGYIVTGGSVLPVNILLTITLVRLSLDYIADFSLRGKMHFNAVCFVLFLFALPTSMIVDYGFLAVILAMFGYIVRHPERLHSVITDSKHGYRNFLRGYMLYSAFTFIVVQALSFNFTQPQLIFMSVGVFLVHVVLSSFKNLVFEDLTVRVGAIVSSFLRFCGRYTLHLYIVHMLFLMVLAVIFERGDYGWFQWSWG